MTDSTEPRGRLPKPRLPLFRQWTPEERADLDAYVASIKSAHRDGACTSRWWKKDPECPGCSGR